MNNDSPQEAFFLAIENGDKQNVIDAIDKGAKVFLTRNGEQALHKVAFDGYEGLPTILVEKGASVNAINASGMTPIHLAAAAGHEVVVRELLSLGANPSMSIDDECSPLLLAKRNGHLGIVEILKAAMKDAEKAKLSNQR